MSTDAANSLWNELKEWIKPLLDPQHLFVMAVSLSFLFIGGGKGNGTFYLLYLFAHLVLRKNYTWAMFFGFILNWPVMIFVL